MAGRDPMTEGTGCAGFFAQTPVTSIKVEVGTDCLESWWLIRFGENVGTGYEEVDLDGVLSWWRKQREQTMKLFRPAFSHDMALLVVQTVLTGYHIEGRENIITASIMKSATSSAAYQENDRR